MINHLKKRYGNRIKGISYLHCCADLLEYSNLNLINTEKSSYKRGSRLKNAPFDYYVAVSKAVKNSFLNYNILDKNRTIVIPNGIDTAIYNPKDKPAISKEIKIGYSGRLTDAKGVEIISDLLLLTQDNSNFKYYITTDLSHRGINTKKLVNSIKSTNPKCMKNINFIIDLSKFRDDKVYIKLLQHHLQNELLPQYFSNNIQVDIIQQPIQKNVDIMIIPSKNEALSLSALESLFCNTPIITSGIGGLSELPTKNNLHTIIKQFTANSYLDAILKTPNTTTQLDPSLLLKYTASHMAKQFDSLIDHIL